MTKDELKQQLHRYRDLDAERLQLSRELEKIEDIMAGPKGTSWDGMPRSPGVGDPVLGVVTKHLALQERYRKKVEELAAAQASIEDRIERLEPKARKLMRHRYIEGLSWEEVCVAMCYSWRQTHNIHAAALDALLAAEDEKKGPKIIARVVEERVSPDGESLTVELETTEDFDPCDICADRDDCWHCRYGGDR